MLKSPFNFFRDFSLLNCSIQAWFSISFPEVQPLSVYQLHKNSGSSSRFCYRTYVKLPRGLDWSNIAISKSQIAYHFLLNSWYLLLLKTLSWKVRFLDYIFKRTLTNWNGFLKSFYQFKWANKSFWLNQFFHSLTEDLIVQVSELSFIILHRGCIKMHRGEQEPSHSHITHNTVSLLKD